MATYPHAVQKRLARNHGGRRKSTRAVVLHVDAGGADSLYGWFSNPASSASSHFYVKYDGTVEQYLDTDLTAWTQRDGNATCIGIETQGKGDGQWTAAQLASIVALVGWLCDLYGIPRADMVTSRPAARGVGMHRYGISPWRVSGGQTWGPGGKACPGNLRVAQFGAVIAALQPTRATTTTSPAVPDEEDPMIIYRAAGERTKFGVLAHNGGFVELQTRAEYDNLRKAGAREVWVEKFTLKNLIADARSH